MSLINTTYFQSQPCEIKLPEQSGGWSQDVSNSLQSDLDKAIKRNEKIYLTKLLGKELYAEFILTQDDAKWDDLKALLANSEELISPIANYVYCAFLNTKKYETTDGIHFSETKSDNVVKVSNDACIVKAWNDMVDMNYDICDYLNDNFDTLETTAELDYSQWENLTTYQNIFGI